MRQTLSRLSYSDTYDVIPVPCCDARVAVLYFLVLGNILTLQARPVNTIGPLRSLSRQSVDPKYTSSPSTISDTNRR